VDVGILEVAKTTVSFDALLRNAELALGRSASASLDVAGLPLRNPASLIAVAAEIKKQGSDALRAMREDKASLRHVHYVFLLKLPRDNFMDLAGMAIAITPSTTDDVALASGRLFEWQHCVVELLAQGQPRVLRTLGMMLLAWFELQGLGEVWGLYEKKYENDRTYYLEPK
jgi:hypothetical protein